jgi:hypothetical protein
MCRGGTPRREAGSHETELEAMRQKTREAAPGSAVVELPR